MAKSALRGSLSLDNRGPHKCAARGLARPRGIPPADREPYRQPTRMRIALASNSPAKKVRYARALLGPHLAAPHDLETTPLGGLQQRCELRDHDDFRDEGCPRHLRHLHGQGTLPMEPQGGRIDDDIEGGWVERAPGL